jgi:hypothetical protein
MTYRLPSNPRLQRTRATRSPLIRQPFGHKRQLWLPKQALTW